VSGRLGPRYRLPTRRVAEQGAHRRGGPPGNGDRLKAGARPPLMAGQEQALPMAATPASSSSDRGLARRSGPPAPRPQRASGPPDEGRVLTRAPRNPAVARRAPPPPRSRVPAAAVPGSSGQSQEKSLGPRRPRTRSGSPPSGSCEGSARGCQHRLAPTRSRRKPCSCSRRVPRTDLPFMGCCALAGLMIRFCRGDRRRRDRRSGPTHPRSDPPPPRPGPDPEMRDPAPSRAGPRA